MPELARRGPQLARAGGEAAALLGDERGFDLAADRSHGAQIGGVAPHNLQVAAAATRADRGRLQERREAVPLGGARLDVGGEALELAAQRVALGGALVEVAGELRARGLERRPDFAGAAGAVAPEPSCGGERKDGGERNENGPQGSGSVDGGGRLAIRRPGRPPQS